MLDALRTAIESRRQIRLNYDPGHRVIEPHTLGYGAEGQMLLRAYQVDGASSSGEPVHWKLFRVDRINSVDVGDVKFSGPRDGYKKNDRAMKGGIIAEL